MTPDITCPYCGKDSKLVTGAKVYPARPDLHDLQFWMCEPCKAWVGCHKNTDALPLGRLANRDLRRWKQSAHAMFDPLWKRAKNQPRTHTMNRKTAYLWLAGQLGIKEEECHIGLFDETMCRRVVEVCRKLRKL